MVISCAARFCKLVSTLRLYTRQMPLSSQAQHIMMLPACLPPPPPPPPPQIPIVQIYRNIKGRQDERMPGLLIGHTHTFQGSSLELRATLAILRELNEGESVKTKHTPLRAKNLSPTPPCPPHKDTLVRSKLPYVAVTGRKRTLV